MAYDTLPHFKALQVALQARRGEGDDFESTAGERQALLFARRAQRAFSLESHQPWAPTHERLQAMYVGCLEDFRRITM